MIWLLAASLLIGSAVMVLIGARSWWYLALPGVLISQLLIVQAWSDAKAGTLANIIIAVPLLLLTLDARPGSFRTRFGHDSAALLARPVRPSPIVTDADIAGLPPLMQRYLRRVGAVGRPPVRNMRVMLDAEMRQDSTSPWMRSTIRQYEFFDPPARLFT